MQEDWEPFPSSTEETLSAWYKKVFSSEKNEYEPPGVDAIDYECLEKDDEDEEKQKDEQ